jgi:DNA-binding LacI/PurR family transcriptional regulator
MRFSPSRRPLVKQEAILDSLRQQIVSGKLGPGGRMPTRDELGRHFGVTRVTLQRAMDQLTRDGFIYSRGKLGTFVSENPPHLSSYALVFYSTPEDPGWPRFWTALANEAMALARVGPIKFSTYYGVTGSTDNEDYQRLLHDIHAHRLAGLIFSALPDSLAHTPIVAGSTTPRVAIMWPKPGCHVPAVYPDLSSFVDRALDALAARGRRRVAVVSNSPWWDQMEEAFLQGVKTRGMEFRPYWAQMVDVPNALRAVHLLMHDEQKTRPDGLIIADDNLVEHAVAGLLAAGVRVPADVEVVAHCNFPWPVPNVVPVLRLGFDARKVMAASLESLAAQRCGQSPPEFVRVKAQFEEETIQPAPLASGESGGVEAE